MTSEPIQYANVPREVKQSWGDGPWVDEPDKVQWVDAGTNLDCLAVRNHMGAWCGYVGLPPGHRHHGKAYQDVHGEDDNWLHVHGGLTFAAACQERDDPAVGICHVPLEGRPADVWWLGFDCGHSMDYQPAMEARLREMEELRNLPPLPPMPSGWRSTYRNLAYVQAEVTQLAAQLV